ncbi:MAG: hypothetical protein ACE5KH_00985 [Candidatus Geothermarchaeales archaeon]
MEQLRVRDANDAKAIAYSHLEMQLHPKKILGVSFARVWYSEGVRRDTWELEGRVRVKQGLLRTRRKRFRLQIDPVSGNILGFDQQFSPLQRP